MIPVETTRAFLPSNGYDDGRPTLHIYSHREPIHVQAYCGRGGLHQDVIGQALIFRCTQSGVDRQWGIDLSEAVTYEDE